MKIRRALIVAAHPDDEVLGCGGTMAGLVAGGSAVHVAHLADGVTSRAGTPAGSPELDRRRGAAREAGKILGATSVDFFDYPDNRLDTVALLEIVQTIEGLIDRYKPDTVFTHHHGDVNMDHRVLHDAVTAACRPQGATPVRTVMSFEVPSSTEWHLRGPSGAFVPNWFVDITAHTAVKRRALEAYAMEMREWPHSRSYQGVEALQRWRGATIGVEAAEAFVVVRHVERG